jgi:HSP20 family protein
MAENKETPKTPEARKGQGIEKQRGPGSFLEPWEGFGVFPQMQRFAEEMDHLFEDFGMLWPRRRRPSLLNRMFGREAEGKPQATWSPRIEMMERDGNLVIRAELPGMSKDDVKVEVTDEAVTIQGERKEEKKEEAKGYHYSECRYGSFFRSLPLPEGSDPSKATAEFRNGVLEVVMPGPKHPEKKARPIEVKGE